MWQFLVFQDWAAKPAFLQYFGVARNAWDDSSQATKCLFLQCLQLVPAEFLVNKAFHICELHFALRFLWFFWKPKLPHCTWRYQPHIYIYTYTYIHAGKLFSRCLFLKRSIPGQVRKHLSRGGRGPWRAREPNFCPRGTPNFHMWRRGPFFVRFQEKQLGLQSRDPNLPGQKRWDCRNKELALHVLHSLFLVILVFFLVFLFFPLFLTHINTKQNKNNK